jgi:hypothetical protein
MGHPTTTIRYTQKPSRVATTDRTHPSTLGPDQASELTTDYRARPKCEGPSIRLRIRGYLFNLFTAHKGNDVRSNESCSFANLGLASGESSQRRFDILRSRFGSNRGGGPEGTAGTTGHRRSFRH